MQIESLDSSALSRWDHFVEQCEAASFFHLAGWRQVIEQVFRHQSYYFYSHVNGQINGVLPLVHVRSRFFGNALISTPFCVYGGCATTDEQARAALQAHAVKLAAKLKVDYLELRYQQKVNMEWPCKANLYVSFRKNIDPDVERNLLNIPRKQRAMVRKGIKAGLVSECDDEVNRFYDVYASSVRDHGTPVFAKKYFQTLKDVFGEQCEIMLAHKGNRVHSAVMNFYFRDQVLPYYGGGYPIARQNKAFDFLYWEVMRRACERGYKIFDYGRSKLGTGSFSFKKNWGFVPEALYYEYQLFKGDQLPNVNPLNPKYKLFIQMWKRMPLRLTKLIGPHIVRNLG